MDLNKLPPPPKNQTGLSLSELPKPPKGQKGSTLADLSSSKEPQTGILGTNKNDSTYGKIIDNSITRGIQSFFPGQKVGQAIGTLGGYAASDNKDTFDTSAPTPLQVGGDIAAGAASIAGAKLPGASSIVGSVAQNAGLAAAGAAGTAVAEAKPVDDVIKSALTAGAIGGTVAGVTGLAGKAVSAVTKNAPERLYNSAVKPTLNETKKAIKFNGNTLGQELIDRGVTGSEKSLLSKAQNEVIKNEDKLQQVLSASKQTIRRDELAPFLDDLVASKNATPGLATEAQKVKDVLDEFPDELTVSQANVIKRNIYSALKDTAFVLDPNLTTKKEAMKALASGIRETIEQKTASEVGEGTVKAINQELSVFGRLEDRAIDAIARSNKNNLLGLGDYGTLGLGAIAGGAPGAIALEATKRIIESPIFKTNAAVKLSQLGKYLDKIPVDSAGRISRAALVTLLSKLGK